MTDNEHLPTFDAIIGRNVSELRKKEGWTQDQLSAYFADFGLTWSAATIAALETGRRQVLASELVALIFALRIPPEELVAGDGPVLLVPGLRDLDGVRNVLTIAPGKLTLGHVASFKVPAVEQDLEWGKFRQAIGVLEASKQMAEIRLARRLNVHSIKVAEAAQALFGHSLTDERNHRADERTTVDMPERAARAIRSHITRELEKEIRTALEGGLE